MIFPRQKIYNINLLKIFIKSFFPKRINENNFSRILKKILDLNKNIKISFTSKARVGLYFIIKFLIKKKNKNKFILSPLTVYDLINNVIAAGGEPYFIDHEAKSFQISISSLEKILINEKQICAIILCNYCYNCDLVRVKNICKKYDVDVILDGAISITSKLGNNSIFNYVDYSFLSFNLFKFCSSIFGGAVLTKNEDLKIFIDKEQLKWNLYSSLDLINYFIKGIIARLLTNYFIFNHLTFKIFRFGDLKKIKLIQNLTKNDPNPRFNSFLDPSHKRKMNYSQQQEIERQLKYIFLNHSKRFKNFNKLYNNIDNENILIFKNKNLDSRHSYINFPILCKNREELSRYLYDHDIDHGKHFYRNCSDLKIFKNYFRYCKNVNEISNNIILIPVYDDINSFYLKKIINIINAFKSNN